MANFGRLNTSGMKNVRVVVVTSQGERIPLAVDASSASFSRGGATTAGKMYTYGTQTVFGSSTDNSAAYGKITAPIAANIENSEVIELFRGDTNLTVTFEEVGINGGESHHFEINNAVLFSPTDEDFETGTEKTVEVVFIGQPSA